MAKTLKQNCNFSRGKLEEPKAFSVYLYKTIAHKV